MQSIVLFYAFDCVRCKTRGWHPIVGSGNVLLCIQVPLIASPSSVQLSAPNLPANISADHFFFCIKPIPFQPPHPPLVNLISVSHFCLCINPLPIQHPLVLNPASLRYSNLSYSQYLILANHVGTIAPLNFSDEISDI